jgi:N-acyl-D-aspartate/D-glutamate deacylase
VIVAFRADVGIIDGKVAAIGRLARSSSRQVIDAGGKIVAPGHVTQHSHYDVALFWDPYCSNSGENGVTTVVNANCGFGVAPVRPRDIERTMQMLETTEQIPVAHQRSALPWDWESFPEYLARVEQLPKGVNVLTYLPLNPLLVYVVGIDAAKTRRPTAAEMTEMHRLINEAMDAGAIGISLSLRRLFRAIAVAVAKSPIDDDPHHHHRRSAAGMPIGGRYEGSSFDRTPLRNPEIAGVFSQDASPSATISMTVRRSLIFHTPPLRCSSSM